LGDTQEELVLVVKVSADVLWKIGNGHVNRISRLPSKDCKLSLVQGNDYQNYGDASLAGFPFNFLLK